MSDKWGAPLSAQPPAGIVPAVGEFAFGAGGTDTGNYFATWASLVAAMTAMPGRKTLYFEDALTIIPAGAWDMLNVAWVGSLDGEVRTVRFANGASVTNLVSIGWYLTIESVSNASPITDIGVLPVFTLHDGATIVGYDPPVIELGGNATIRLQDGAMFSNAGFIGPVITANTNTLFLECGRNSIVQSATLRAGGGTLIPTIIDPSANVSWVADESFGGLSPVIANVPRLQPVVLGDGSWTPVLNTLNSVTPTGGATIDLTLTKIKDSGGYCYDGASIVIQHNGDPTGIVTIDPHAGNTINGSAGTLTMTVPGETYHLIADGATNWTIVARPASSVDTTQRWTFTAVGTEGNDFMVDLPAARATNGFIAQATCSDCAAFMNLKLPDATLGDRTTTQLRVLTSVAVTAGDRIDFLVMDRS